MKEAYWGYWLVVLGVFIIVVLLLVQSFTSSNTQDYYLVKTITEAAMEDAIDFAYYRQYGELKINKEKFYESFLRRFAEEASIATTYDIEFSEIYEAPPKVGVKVSSRANTFNIAGDAESFDIVNRIDAILESNAEFIPTAGTNNEFWYASVSQLDGVLTENNSIKNVLTAKSCKYEFKDDVCTTNGTKAPITIYKCGTPTELGILQYDLDSTDEYCIAYKTGNDKCQIIATFNTFDQNACS
ncbi:MAG: hypothetical protein IJO63_04910 [Bacilli bacterium]|nr:hypothetical protein [Bacilli bacterium]